uniref:DUF4129 domain-containing protein n=1 Tax=Ignisphaera aggregans TaxID=334771 RepID=A0A7J3JRI1_9CREN
MKILDYYMKILSVSLLLMLILDPMWMPCASVHAQLDNVDPAPLAKILQDVVEAIVSGNYSEALLLCEKALAISLPKDIIYTHSKLYRNIEQVVNLLIQADDVITSGIGDSSKLYVLLNELHIAKLKLMETIDSYVSKLLPFFKDSNMRRIIVGSLTNYILNLDAKLEATLTKLMQLYLGTYGKEIYIELHHQPVVYGGGTLGIDILSITDLDINYVNLTLVLIYGDMLSQMYQYAIPVGENAKIDITTPSVEDIIAMGLEPAPKINAKLFVIAKAVDGKVLGYQTSNFQLVYIYPSIRISVPSYIRPGEEIEVNISADLDYPLNLLIYLNTVSNASLLANLTLSPGERVLALSSRGLPAGYNKLIFLSEPRGKYLAYRFSHNLIIMLEKTVSFINTKPFVIIPFMKPGLEIYVDPPINYNATIYVGDTIAIRYESISNSKIAAEFSLPPTFFFWKYRVLVEIQPNNPSYSPVIVENSIYVLNVATLAIALILIAVITTSPSKMGYIATALILGGSTVKSLISRTKNTSVLHTTVIRYVFRKSRLLNLYKKITAVVSKYIEPPRPSETLREFYCRFSKAFSNSYILPLVKTFLELYEKDLYSSHYIDFVEAMNIVKQIEEVENR